MKLRVALALVLIVTVVGGCLSESEVIMRYQCYDGTIVSDLSSCSKKSGEKVNDSSSKTTTLTGVSECVTGTTLPCVCAGTATTIPTTTVPKQPCASDTDCGQVSSSDIRCSSGDAYVIVYTPFCDKGYCVTRADYQLQKNCGDNEKCVKGSGCVPDVQPE